MASTTFSGPVTSLNGFIGNITGAVAYTELTAASTLTAAQSGTVFFLNATSEFATTLPAPVAGSGWRLSGTNRSDDLFIYVKCKLTGLPTGKTYRVGFSVTMLTNAPSGCVGVGGAPGEGVTLHAGMSATEPLTLDEPWQALRTGELVAVVGGQVVWQEVHSGTRAFPVALPINGRREPTPA